MPRTKTLNNTKSKKISQKTGARFPTKIPDIDYGAPMIPVVSNYAIDLLLKLYRQKTKPAYPEQIMGMAPYPWVPFAIAGFIVAHWFMESVLNETAMFCIRRTYKDTKRFKSEAEALSVMHVLFLKTMSSPADKVALFDDACGTRLSQRSNLMEKIIIISEIRDLLYHHEANSYTRGKAPACVAKLFKHLPVRPDPKSWMMAGWSPVLNSRASLDFVATTMVEMANALSEELGHKHSYLDLRNLVKKPGVMPLFGRPGLVSPIEAAKAVQKKFSIGKLRARVIAAKPARRGGYYLVQIVDKCHVIYVGITGRFRKVSTSEVSKIRSGAGSGWYPLPVKDDFRERMRGIGYLISKAEPL